MGIVQGIVMRVVLRIVLGTVLGIFMSIAFGIIVNVDVLQLPIVGAFRFETFFGIRFDVDVFHLLFPGSCLFSRERIVDVFGTEKDLGLVGCFTRQFYLFSLPCTRSYAFGD